VKSETIFAALAVFVAAVAFAAAGVSIGLQLGTQAKLDRLEAAVEEHLEQLRPRPVVRPRRPGELGELGTLEQ
jgi:hypothetical protein